MAEAFVYVHPQVNEEVVLRLRIWGSDPSPIIKLLECLCFHFLMNHIGRMIIIKLVLNSYCKN